MTHKRRDSRSLTPLKGQGASEGLRADTGRGGGGAGGAADQKPRDQRVKGATIII